MELCLGTVQFGMDYGVFNTPKKDMAYCVSCMEYAIQHGIRAIDTAAAYGNAEEVVGKFLKKNIIDRKELFISTKLLPNILDDFEPKDYAKVILENLDKSLATLHTDYVDVYLLHSSRYAFNNDILKALHEIKTSGKALKVGVSAYYPEEVQACYNSSYVEYVQVPYSIFDHRMKDGGAFEKEKMGNCQIDVRTAFIKGLIRLQEDEVPEHLAKAKPILRQLDEFSAKTGYSRIDLAIGYIKRQKTINHLVFGVRDIEQLKLDIEAFEKEIPEDIFYEIDEVFKNIDADIVVPSLWKK